MVAKRKAESEVEAVSEDEPEVSSSEEEGSEAEEEDTAAGFKSKGKGKGKGKVVELEQPKRARSAYIFYTMENREAIKEELGEDAAPKDIMAELGARWKELDDDEKKPYLKQAERDKKRAEKEIAAFEKKGGVMATKKKNASPAKGKGKGKGKKATSNKAKKTTPRDPNKPKLPKQAFDYYFDERWEQESAEGGDWHGMTKEEAKEEAKEEWKAMDKEERQPYSDIRKTKKDEYEVAIAAYNKKQKKQKTAAAAEEDEEEEEGEEEAEGGEGGDDEGEGEGAEGDDETMEVTEDEA